MGLKRKHGFVTPSEKPKKEYKRCRKKGRFTHDANAPVVRITKRRKRSRRSLIYPNRHLTRRSSRPVAPNSRHSFNDVKMKPVV